MICENHTTVHGLLIHTLFIELKINLNLYLFSLNRCWVSTIQATDMCFVSSLSKLGFVLNDNSLSAF